MVFYRFFFYVFVFFFFFNSTLDDQDYRITFLPRCNARYNTIYIFFLLLFCVNSAISPAFIRRRRIDVWSVKCSRTKTVATKKGRSSPYECTWFMFLQTKNYYTVHVKEVRLYIIDRSVRDRQTTFVNYERNKIHEMCFIIAWSARGKKLLGCLCVYQNRHLRRGNPVEKNNCVFIRNLKPCTMQSYVQENNQKIPFFLSDIAILMSETLHWRTVTFKRSFQRKIQISREWWLPADV